MREGDGMNDAPDDRNIHPDSPLSRDLALMEADDRFSDEFLTTMTRYVLRRWPTSAESTR
jgi:hypothetical protein